MVSLSYCYRGPSHRSLAQAAAAKVVFAESKDPVLYRGMAKVLQDISEQGFAIIDAHDNVHVLAKYIGECHVGCLVDVGAEGVPRESTLAARKSGCKFVIMPASQTMRLLVAWQLRSLPKETASHAGGI